MIYAIVAPFAVAAALGLGLLADSTDVTFLHDVSSLDAPTLLVLFIVLLYKRKLVWGYQIDELKADLEEWKAAAQARTSETEHAATIAEAALRASFRERKTRE